MGSSASQSAQASSAQRSTPTNCESFPFLRPCQHSISSHAIFYNSDDPNKCQNYRSQTPWPRFGRVDEVGSAVLFLASDASDYCNGSDFGMDAGYNIA